MKKQLLIIASLIVAAACASTHAGTPAPSNDKSMTFEAERITAFATTLPVEVVITDSSSPRAYVDIPSEELARWIVCELRGSTLCIYQRKNAGRKLDALSANNPIKVRIESSEIGDISNTSSANITCRNKRFANSLSISNTGALRILADDMSLGGNFYAANTGRLSLNIKSMKASGKITLTNTGRITSNIENFECRVWDKSNTGVIDLSSRIKADKVICTGTGRDRLSLEVDCRYLEIVSTGAGDMKFTGHADDISITSTGSARISTAEVNRPNN